MKNDTTILQDVRSVELAALPECFNKQEGWYQPDDFNLLLRREQERSQRSGNPTAYIALELCKERTKSQTLPRKDFENLLNALIMLITRNTRFVDIKSISDAGAISILLVDTSLEGAKAFIEKIVDKFFDYLKGEDHPRWIKMIRNVSISCFPLGSIESCNRIEGIPIMVRNLHFEDRSEKKNGKPDSPPVNGIDNSNGKAPIKANGLALERSLVLTWKAHAGANGNLVQTQQPYIAEDQQFYEFSKRVMDIFGAIAGLLLFGPVMLLVAALIKLTSEGPVLFKQERVGLGGSHFTFLKFRTMRVNNDDSVHQDYVRKLIEGKEDEINNGSEENPVYKLTNDDRITVIGHFLRRTSLDEIPQLFNVLTGTMSLVGPRPPIPYEVAVYKSWHLRRVLDAKPGITGLWQVYGRNRTTFDEMVRLDLQYIQQRSLLFDIQLIVKTVTGMLFSKEGL